MINPAEMMKKFDAQDELIRTLRSEGKFKDAVIEAAEAFQNSRFEIPDYSKESLALDEALVALAAEERRPDDGEGQAAALSEIDR